jgi:hypothetical protein
MPCSADEPTKAKSLGRRTYLSAQTSKPTSPKLKHALRRVSDAVGRSGSGQRPPDLSSQGTVTLNLPQPNDPLARRQDESFYNVSYTKVLAIYLAKPRAAAGSP